VTKGATTGADASGLGASTRVEAVASIDAISAEWDTLARESRNIFSTREWASTWWRHRAEDHVPLVFACRTDDGPLLAVLPLYLSATFPARVARFIGHGPADELGPICAPPSRAIGAKALQRILSLAEIDFLLAELLPCGYGWEADLGGRPLKVESSPTISLARGWDAYLASRSANLRQQVRRRERRLGREHAVTFRLASDAARLQDDLDIFLSLHLARWGKTRSAFLRWEAFHREFAKIALERGWLRLWFLHLDERPVAAWFGFRFAGVESYYQAGRDPMRSDDAVGFVLLAHTIREAARDGMSEYRLLRGAEAFKRRFATADAGLGTFALVRGIRGRGARLAARAALRSDRIRLALGRLSGSS
jgi:CelD/BcsL family acetyltransferase involved in cellulose biosynthesis